MGTRLKSGEGLAGRVAQSRQPLMLDDYSAWEHRLPHFDGVGLGATISWVVHAVSKMPTYVSMWSVITGITVSAVIGVFFGFYPAMRAARLDPVDSLRYE